MRRSAIRISTLALMLVCLAAFPSAADGPLHYYTLSSPCRLLDTRTTNPPSPMSTATERPITVKGACGVATDAKAVLLNVTAVSNNGGGPAFLTLYPTGITRPVSSNINLNPNDTVANGATVTLASTPSNDLTIFAYVGTGTVHVILDVAGYFK